MNYEGVCSEFLTLISMNLPLISRKNTLFDNLTIYYLTIYYLRKLMFNKNLGLHRDPFAESIPTTKVLLFCRIRKFSCKRFAYPAKFN